MHDGRMADAARDPATEVATTGSAPLDAPDLSVILVTPDDYGTIRETVRHLGRQTVRRRIEVIIAAPSVEALRLESGDLDGFFGHRVVEVGAVTHVARAKAQAIRVASAPVVALGEDHCFPAPDWAEALLARYAGGWAGVGPVIRNANPGTATSWAGLLMHFGAWVEPAAAGEVPQIPWHNGSFKRDLLLAYGEELPRMLVIEGFLQRDLRARGHRLYLEPAAVAYHVNISRLGAWLAHAYVGGRLFGATRVIFERWSLGRRLVHTLGTPLVPLVRLRPLLDEMRRTGVARRLLPAILGPVSIGLLAHALGEVVGYVAGAGDAERRYANYEMRRWRFLTAVDRRAMAGRVVPGGLAVPESAPEAA